MADKAILKYDPQEVLRQPKEIGTFQPAGGDKGFYTLQFQSNGQPIKLSVRGQIENNGGIFKFDQFQKLRCVVDISGNGVVQYVTTQLIKTLQVALENESLPDLKLNMKPMFYNNKIYCVIHRDKKGLKDFQVQYGNVDFGVINSETKQEEYQKFLEKIEPYNGPVIVDVELYCWARKDDEKHELIVGFTPRLEAINFLDLSP